MPSVVRRASVRSAKSYRHTLWSSSPSVATARCRPSGESRGAKNGRAPDVAGIVSLAPSRPTQSFDRGKRRPGQSAPVRCARQYGGNRVRESGAGWLSDASNRASRENRASRSTSAVKAGGSRRIPLAAAALGSGRGALHVDSSGASGRGRVVPQCARVRDAVVCREARDPAAHRTHRRPRSDQGQPAARAESTHQQRTYRSPDRKRPRDGRW